MHQGIFRLIIAVLAAFFLNACSSDQATTDQQRDSSRSADHQLDQLIDRYLADYWHQHPDRATRVGLSAWNDRLPAMAADDLMDNARQIREVLKTLESINPDHLGSVDHQVDWQLLGQHARVRLAEIERLPRWQREPRLYLPVHAFNDLILDTDAPIEQRAEWILARLHQLPTLLTAGRANLDAPPQAFTLDAIRSSQLQLLLFQQTLPEFARQVPALEADILQASARAATAVAHYIEFLREDLLPRSTGQIAVGREMYDFYLREIHALNMSTDELIALGERYYAETERLLDEQAERIEPGRHWVEIIDDIGNDHPTHDDLLAAEEEERLRRSHELPWVRVLASQEAYPGHLLQALQTQENERPLRKFYSVPALTEGRGLFSEPLIREHGFVDPTEQTRLTQLRLRLWRAARVLLDARIHTGEITVDQARHFLADHIRMEHAATADEVNIYIYRPSYAIGYVVGHYEMMALREVWLNNQATRTEIRAFEDQVLGLGSIPFPAVRELLESD